MIKKSSRKLETVTVIVRGEKTEDDELDKRNSPSTVSLLQLFIASFISRLTFARLTPVVARGRNIKAKSMTRAQDNR